MTLLTPERRRRVLHGLTGWSALTKLGKSRTIQTSYFWLIAVPIAVKILGPFQDSLGTDQVFHVFGREITLHVGLPFSWKLFFWSAVLLGIANLIYQVTCPAAIKDLGGDRSRLSQVGSDVFDYYRAMLSDRIDTANEALERHEIWDRANELSPVTRWICVFLYWFGLGLVATVIVQNLIFVIPLLL